VPRRRSDQKATSGVKVEKDGFTVGAADTIRAIGKTKKTNLCVLHLGNKTHTGYTSLTGLPLDNSNQDLLNLLARNAFNDTRFARNIAMPAGPAKPPAAPSTR
jgi:hypothetical protein